MYANQIVFLDPTKFFGCELGAQTQFDLKHDRYIVNGAHEAGKLQEMLDVFIKKFVLCPGCDNPETVLTVTSFLKSHGLNVPNVSNHFTDRF